MATSTRPADKPYPDTWDNVAEIKIFRAPAEEWDKLSTWSTEMRRKGWRLLRVTSDPEQLVAIFGKTKRR